MSRLINSAGLALIKESEGLRLEPYLDTGKVWTCGYGHTKGVTEFTHCTPEIAEAWLEADLMSAEEAVSDLVKVKLSDNQFAALVCFVFNVGKTQFAHSTLLRKLNEGGYALVPACLRSWIYDNGKVIAGLVKRRNAEANLWSMS
jgi:lysozyme